MPTILLYGDNGVEIDEAARALRASFDPGDTIILQGSDMSLASLSEACLTAGLFAPERLVMVHALHERLKSTRKENPEADEIRSIMSSLVPSTTLLLIAKGMPADHALVADVRTSGGKLQFYAVPRRGDLARWIVARGKRKSAIVERDAADLLADMVGANPVLLENELEKLVTYAGEQGSITPDMVQALVGAVPQDTIFALVDAVAAGDRATALRLLHSQLEVSSSGPEQFSFQLIRMLTRQIRILLRLKLGQEAGRSTNSITTELKIPRYYADRYIRQAQRLSREHLRVGFEQLASLEHALKSGRAEPGTGLDLLVADLCS